MLKFYGSTIIHALLYILSRNEMFLIYLTCFCLSASYTQTWIMGVHPQPNSEINFHGFLMHFHRVIVLKGEKELIQQV